MSDVSQPRNVVEGGAPEPAAAFKGFAAALRRGWETHAPLPFQVDAGGRTVLVDWKGLFTPGGPDSLEHVAEEGLFQFFALLRVFDSVFFRASPYFAELLKRKITMLAIQHWYVPEPSAFMPLTEREETVLQVWYKQVKGKKTPLLHSLVASANATFSAFVPGNARKKCKLAAGDGDPADYSLFNIDPELFLADVNTPSSAVLKYVYHPGFVTGNLNPFTTELVVARDLGRTGAVPSGLSGVKALAPSTATPDAPRVTAVNLLKFYNYRNVMTDRYKQILPARVARSPEAAVDILREKYETASAALRPLHRGYEFSAFCENYLIGEGRLCANLTEWNQTILMATDEFDRVLDTYQRIERRSTGEKKKPGPKKLTERKSFTEIYVDPMTGVSYPFIFCGYDVKKLYVSPPWFVAEDAVSVVRGGHRYITNGARVFKGFPGRYFFTYKRLFELEDSLINQISGIRTWMNEKMVRSPKTTLKKDRVLTAARFEPVEDAAIIKYYRRGMTKQDWADLHAVCLGRTRVALILRARDLCKTLVLAGERDLSKLPLQRRTGEFLAWFRTIKEGDA